MKSCLASLIFFLTFQLNAQELIPLHTWRGHLSYNEVVDLDVKGSSIIAAAKEGIFIYDMEDGSISTLTALEGLHPSEITTIGYDASNDILFVGHVSGVIDIVFNNEIVQLFDLQEDHRSEKTINDFYFKGSKAYISTEIGLLVYDITRRLFIATYDGLSSQGDDVAVNEITIADENIFAATTEGIIVGSLNGANLNDFSEWERFEPFNASEVSAIESIGGEVYAAVTNDEIYYWNEEQWEPTGFLQNTEIRSLHTSGDKLVIATENSIFYYENNILSEVSLEELKSPQYALFRNEHLWIADNGLVSHHNDISEIIKPSAPSSHVLLMEVVENVLYGFPGRGSEAVGYDTFKNGLWQNYNSTAVNDEFKIPQFQNAWDVAYYKEMYFISSYSDGLLVIDEGSKFVWTAADPDNPFEMYSAATRITGLEVSSAGLWILNYGASQALHLYDGSGFQSFTLLKDLVLDLVIAPNGFVIMRVDGGGLLVFDPSTGEQRLLTSDSDKGDLPSSHVNDMVFDTDSRLWVATESGIVYFNSAASLMDPEVIAIKPIFNNRYLFNNSNVTALAIDGGGRKWMGTEDGAWLFNKDLTDQIYYFNEESSPLVSNYIEDIMIFQATGEVFLATAGGLVSFRTDASTPKYPEEKAKIFPNPVDPSYQGSVGITGISANASVKITDISGNLIFQTKANGSTASWDLFDHNGRRVASGVYLVFTAKEDGTEPLVGKIAVIR